METIGARKEGMGYDSMYMHGASKAHVVVCSRGVVCACVRVCVKQRNEGYTRGHGAFNFKHETGSDGGVCNIRERRV